MVFPFRPMTIRCLAHGAATLRSAYGAAAQQLKALALAAALVLSPGSPSQAEEPLRLIAFGDSLVHGFGLPPAQAFPAQLQDWIEAEGLGPVEVVNMGVSGETTSGGRARLEWSLREGADAIIIVLGGNDLLRGLDPERSKQNLDVMLTLLGERNIPVLLAGLEAPLNYGEDWKAAFDGMYLELAEKHGAVLVPDFFAPLRGVKGQVMQDDGTHPSALGVAIIVDGIGPEVRVLLDRARGK